MYKIIGGLLPWCHSNYSTEIMAGMKQIVLKYFQITWSDLCKNNQHMHVCNAVCICASTCNKPSNQKQRKQEKKKEKNPQRHLVAVLSTAVYSFLFFYLKRGSLIESYLSNQRFHQFSVNISPPHEFYSQDPRPEATTIVGIIQALARTLGLKPHVCCVKAFHVRVTSSNSNLHAMTNSSCHDKLHHWNAEVRVQMSKWHITLHLCVHNKIRNTA